MKKITLLLSLIFGFALNVNAQNFNYQAAVRDNGGQLIINQSIGVQIKLLQGSASGTTIYTETHTVTSNAYGIISLAIGTGTTTDTFSTINWSTQNHWLETAVDITGGTTYLVIGSSQLMSVPYANHAITSADKSFSTTANVTSNKPGTIATDDFVFGSTQLDNDTNTGDDDYRLFFDKGQGAFRAGVARADQWDASNVGFSSVALGFDNVASGGRSTVLGSSNVASGIGSITLGNNLVNAQSNQVTIGSGNTIDPSASNGIGATSRHFVIGNGTDISRSDALVMLKNGNTTLNGQLTIDGDNTGSGVGYTLPAQDGTANQVMRTDGTGNVIWGTSSNAFSTTANITSNASGTIATDDFVFGSSQLDNIPNNTTDNSRIFFDKSHGAFRAGIVNDVSEGTPLPGDQWDSANIGYGSVGIGTDNKSAGNGAIALGNGNKVESNTNGSVALGVSNTISDGASSFAIGEGNNVTKIFAGAVGSYNTVGGYNNFALGSGLVTKNKSAIALGNHNTEIIGSPGVPNPNNPLLILGNGTSEVNTSNALVVLQNGNTLLNGQLTIDGDNTGTGVGYTLPAQDGTVNQIMRTNGSGSVSWTTLTDNVNDADIDPTNEIELPTQAGNTGKLLSTNGTSPSWVDAPSTLPNQTGQSGKILSTDGTNVSWTTLTDSVDDADNDPTNEIELPTQTGNTGKLLSTNGTSPSWVDAPSTLPSQSGQSGKVLSTDGTNATWTTLTDNVDDADNDPTNEIELPTQTGNSGKLLTTDGTDTVWSSNVTTTSITTSALTITSLPAFAADLNGTKVLSGAGSYNNLNGWRTADVSLPNHLFDNGDNFNEATGEFTAPVNGFYNFTAQIRFDGIQTGYVRLLLAVNNSLSLNSGFHAIAEAEEAAETINYQTLNVGGVMKLNANDKVTVVIHSSSDTSWSINDESGFNGYLISRF